MELNPVVSNIKPKFEKVMPTAFIKLSKTALNQTSKLFGRTLLLHSRAGKIKIEAKTILWLTRFNGSTNCKPTFIKVQFELQIKTTTVKRIQLRFFNNSLSGKLNLKPSYNLKALPPPLNEGRQIFL
jgi:hypothetical protein